MVVFIGGGISSLVFQDSATSSATNGRITGPASIIAGDILILIDKGVIAGSPPGTTIPSGFTAVFNVTGNSTRLITSYKLADGSEAGATIQGMDLRGTGGTSSMIMLVFRPNIAATVLTLSGVASESSTGNPAAQVVPIASALFPAVVVGVYSANASISSGNRSMVPAEDGEFNQTNTLYTKYKIFNVDDTFEDVTVDMGAVSNPNILGSFYMVPSLS